jgi:hypothetical protein
MLTKFSALVFNENSVRVKWFAHYKSELSTICRRDYDTDDTDVPAQIYTDKSIKICVNLCYF